MKIVDTHIIKNFLVAFLYCMTAFISLFIIIDLFSHLDEIIKLKVPLSIVAAYYGAILPYVIVQICPVAVLMATLYNLGHLYKRNELVALKASGISIYRIVFPILIIAFILSIIIFSLGETILPETNTRINFIRENSFEKNSNIKTTWSDVPFYGTKGNLYYIKQFDTKKNILFDVQIIQTRQDGSTSKRVDAKKAIWSDGYWFFYEGFIRDFDRWGLIREVINFEIQKFKFDETPKDFAKKQKSPEEMNIHELKAYIEKLKERHHNPRRELVALHSKFSTPLMNLIVALIGISPFCFIAPRRGITTGVVLSIGLTILFCSFNYIAFALGHGGYLPPILAAWIANLIFGGLGISMLLQART